MRGTVCPEANPITLLHYAYALGNLQRLVQDVGGEVAALVVDARQQCDLADGDPTPPHQRTMATDVEPRSCSPSLRNGLRSHWDVEVLLGLIYQNQCLFIPRY